MRIGKPENLFISKAATAAYREWLALPRESSQLVPKRLELNIDAMPAEVRDHIFLLSYLEETVLSVAFAGSAIEAFLGDKIEGQNLVIQRSKCQQPIEKQYYDAISGQPCAGRLTRHTKNILGNRSNFVSVHLPLLDYKNQANYFLGIVDITNREAPTTKDALNIYGASKVIERVLVDIGAGVPDISKD